jgi:DNA-binding MarR family transcriptional regulator
VSFFLIALGRRARESVEARLREHGLSYHHFSALGHLQRQPGLSYSELARRARVTVQSMQTTAGHLEQQGFVERGATTSQGRRADLHVTVSGLRVLARAEEAMRSTDQELLANVAPAERANLESALLRMFTARSSGGDTIDG